MQYSSANFCKSGGSFDKSINEAADPSSVSPLSVTLDLSRFHDEPLPLEPQEEPLKPLAPLEPREDPLKPPEVLSRQIAESLFRCSRSPQSEQVNLALVRHSKDLAWRGWVDHVKQTTWHYHVAYCSLLGS